MASPASHDTAMAALRSALGRTPPPGLDALDADELSRLAALLLNAKQRQKAEVDAALTESLSHVPMLLRGAVRKILDL